MTACIQALGERYVWLWTTVLLPFNNFGVRDLIDIVVIAVVIYQAYKLLQNSRAWNVVRGLVALGGLWFVADRFDLITTRWLFNRAAPVTFLAVVLVFQTELRTALERVGRVRGARNAMGDPVQEIMSAVRELATLRQGALIAIERHDLLTEYGKSGTLLNTPVTSALLQTIFASKGPLHDGAVIIKNNVITHAGAIFPLSDQHDGWSVKHGTRHRAAVGLSESTDALVIVVSEERGTVSVAEAGLLRSDIAPADVLTALREVYSA